MNEIIKYQNELGRPLILDGAMGSLLQMKNNKLHPVLWTSYLNISSPQEVVDIHKEYIEAGADLITTNTFRTNPISFKESKLDISNIDFVRKSVKLADDARGHNRNVFIAGSNPPVEDSYKPNRSITSIEIDRNHKNHIDFLWDCGVDLILNETQSHFDEIKIICEHCNANSIPFIVSLFITLKLEILSGESLEDILNYIIAHSPIAISINCVHPFIFSSINITQTFNYRWGYYLNCGSGNYEDKEIHEGISPHEYLDILQKSTNQNLFFVGTCCGSSPKHTKAIKEYFDGNKN